jgi:hypothetical protein
LALPDILPIFYLPSLGAFACSVFLPNKIKYCSTLNFRISAN